MEEILIVSNYYPPEKGAAANRIEQLALKLKENGYKVAVICPLANYPKGKLFPQYKGRFSIRENLGGIDVRRLWIYPSNSRNGLVRILSILSFSTCLFFYLLFKKLPKKIVVQSPPLLLSFVSVLILSLKRKKIILNVSDLWPSAAIELGALRTSSIGHKVALIMEKFIYRNATLILGQSNEIISHVRTIVPQKQCFLYRNYPDHQVVNQTESESENRNIKMFYAGLLGVAQGVLDVCENMQTPANIEFHIFGDGAEKVAIEVYMRENPHKNIVFHGMLERHLLIQMLETFDIALVPLKTRIYGSVPSKIFEYSTLGIPILYFGGGEGEDIVIENELGWVAPVGNYESLNTVLKAISEEGMRAIDNRKLKVSQHSKITFDLSLQVASLIEKKVF
ncbi:MAG TPA: glycosyltransferase family 4 protein [Flavobacterium sp.]